MNSLVERPGRANVVAIEISPIDKGGTISLYHAGLGLVAFQRVLNRALEYNDRAQRELDFLSPTMGLELKRRLFLLTIEDVHIGTIDIIAQFAASTPPEMLHASQEVVTQVLSGVLVNVITKFISIQTLPVNKIEVDPALLPSMEELASAGAAGKITFEIRHGQSRCIVDKKTYDVIQELREAESARSDRTETGVVVGSNMRDRRIDIFFDVFDRVIPCYYREDQASAFRKFTRDETKVVVTGDQIWSGNDPEFRAPTKIQLRNIQHQK